ncbi:MAG: pyroglutamyl-peptidase I [Myxococcota bacterium]
MHVLVTGFGGFMDVPSNPSQRLVQALNPVIAGFPIRKVILPVDAIAIRDVLAPLWAEGPVAALHLGVALRRRQVSLETRAHNWLEFEVPDNAGHVVSGRPIMDEGPALVGTRLPVDVIQHRLEQKGVPSNLSRSAGRFICNQVMYESLIHLPKSVPVGFVHVPPDELLSEATGRHTFVPFSLQLKAITSAVETTIQLMDAFTKGSEESGLATPGL